MVSRILQQEEAIRVVLGADRKTTHLVPTWQDIDVLQSIDQALSPLSSLTDILSGEEYVTVSAVMPMMQLIDNKLLKETDDDTQITKDIKQRIKQDLRKRYTNTELGEVMDILKAASFLDPRFKCKYLQDTEVRAIKERLVDEVASVRLRQEGESPQTPSTSQGPPPAKKRNLGTMFKEEEEGQDQMPILSPEQQINAELDAYVSAPKLDPEEDPLAWWKIQTPSYPILCKLVKKYLCVCATSAASERLFSTSGKIVTPLRACLKPDKVDMLVFLSRNL